LTLSDETKEKQQQAFPLTNLNEQLLAFMRIGSAMLEAKDLDEILSAITREVARVIEFDRSSIAFYQPDKNILVLRNIHKGTADKRKEVPVGEGREIPIDESSIVGWVAMNKRPLVRYDIDETSDFIEVVAEEPLRSDIVVPMMIRDELAGTLNIGSYKPNAFTKTDLEVLTNCAQFASLAIEHTMLRLKAQDLLERYKTLQQTANDIIMLIDRNTGKIVEVNKKFTNVLGYTPMDIETRSFFDLFAQEDQYQARRDFINILSQKSTTFVDRRMISQEGNFIYIDINASLITLKEGTFIQMIVHNISQRKMLEQQIIQKNQNLQQVNRKLTQVDSMKTQFLANISHELRTPLSIIIAYTESLRDKSMSDEERETFLDVISENGANLLTLINNLLDLSKLKISGHSLALSLSHVHDVVKSIWDEMAKNASEKIVKLTFEPGVGVPVTYFDNNQLVRVIVCLIQNAIKFTSAGGSVKVTTTSDSSEVLLQVIDTGCGIRPEEIDDIFDAFHQVDGSSSRKEGGLGIGLALAKHIVELHKGRLLVESEYGAGSTFTIGLPIDKQDALQHDRAPSSQMVD